MEQRTCEVCQQLFTKTPGPGRWAKVCSDACRSVRDHATYVEWRQSATVDLLPKHASRSCRGCSTSLPPWNPGTKGNPRVWCSEACRVKAYYWEKKLTGWRAKATPKDHCTVHFFTCSECARLFPARRGDAKYCARDCKLAAAYRMALANGLREKRRAARGDEKFCPHCAKEIRRTDETCRPCGQVLRAERFRREARRRRVERKARKAATGTPANLRWPWVSGVCAGCGEAFTRKGGASPYCSRQCRPDYTIKISKSARLAIYERDLWTCQLCLDPVSPDLPYTDLWSATLDHIVCRSWSEVPDDSPSNLRLAHRWCNAVRGDESYYTESDLNPQMSLQEA